MSRFDLRDISTRLAGSPSAEGLIGEMLEALQAADRHWHASFAIYEMSADALTSVYEREGLKLVRRELVAPLGELPPGLVRKLFPGIAGRDAHPPQNGRGPLDRVPAWVAEPADARSLMALTPFWEWSSCGLVVVRDKQDILGLVVLVSRKRNAFGPRELEQVVAVANMAGLVLAQHLFRERHRQAMNDQTAAERTAEQFQGRINELDALTSQLENENAEKSGRVDQLLTELQRLHADSSSHKQELERARGQLEALEQQSAAATEHLTNAFDELTAARWQLGDLDRTMIFVREVTQALALGQEPMLVRDSILGWLHEDFDIGRVSLMVLDRDGQTLRIEGQRGLDLALVQTVRVSVGQGVSGWVAQNRKPLFVRVGEDGAAGRAAGVIGAGYRTEDFIAVPVIHQGMLIGVLNLTEKRTEAGLDESDLDRAWFAAWALAVSLADEARADRLASQGSDLASRLAS
ncbi:MAG: GAF domain-containing protein [Candidatus Eisenbacteria bacterium]